MKKILCKEDNLQMIPEYSPLNGELYYICEAKGIFSLHFKERIVNVNSLPKKTQNNIYNNKKLSIKKTIRI